MFTIKLRLQEVSDAERFFEILNNPNFIHFRVQPKTIEEEIKWLEENPKRQKNNTGWNYTILFNDIVVGAIGVLINSHRKYIGEVGYFLDEKYWGQGIVSQALKLLESICFNELNLTRIEIMMNPENIGSEKVAIKNGYEKEGFLKKVVRGKDGEMKDCHLYAKVL